MKAAVCAVPAAPSLVLARVLDYVELMRLRVSVLVLFTVAAGYLLAAGGSPDLGQLLHTVLGTGLVAAGASAINQLIERHSDALMTRTENRPLPGGRLLPAEVLAVGVLLGVGGLTYLALAVKHPLAAVVAGVTFVLYVCVYTPLKRVTDLNTLAGAVPGALPPVIGWTAASGGFGPEALALFLVVFLWQLPHFLAIAWIYKDQYGKAGLRMVPVGDETGSRTSLQMVGFCLMLVPASLSLFCMGVGGLWYGLGAVLMGVAFLASTIAFAGAPSKTQARYVLRASLLYLPALLLLLLLDGGLK
jgi:protoheme IX farnesyltransferase